MENRQKKGGKESMKHKAGFLKMSIKHKFLVRVVKRKKGKQKLLVSAINEEPSL